MSLPWVCQQWLRRCVGHLSITELSFFGILLDAFTNILFVIFNRRRQYAKKRCHVCMLHTKISTRTIPMTNIIWGKSNCFGRRRHQNGHLSNYTVAYPTGNSFTIERFSRNFQRIMNVSFQTLRSNTDVWKVYIYLFALAVCSLFSIAFTLLIRKLWALSHWVSGFAQWYARCETLQKRSASKWFNYRYNLMVQRKWVHFENNYVIALTLVKCYTRCFSINFGWNAWKVTKFRSNKEWEQ